MTAGFSQHGCRAITFFEEGRLGADHVLGGLPRDGVGQEADEIARMAEGQRYADLAFGLEAADARAVAGARINDDEGALVRIGRHLGGKDAHQPVVDRARKLCAVHHHLEGKVQHMRRRLFDMGAILVAPRAPHIGIEDRALCRVDGVVPGLLDQRQGSFGHWGLLRRQRETLPPGRGRVLAGGFWRWSQVQFGDFPEPRSPALHSRDIRSVLAAMPFCQTRWA